MWTNPVTGAHEFDEPTMLQLIIHSTNPTTRVGVSNYKMDIKNETLHTFSNNV